MWSSTGGDHIEAQVPLPLLRSSCILCTTAVSAIAPQEDALCRLLMHSALY